MSVLITLDRLAQEQSGEVVRILNKGAMRRRLLDLGIVRGAGIKCVRKGSRADPSAFKIRGAVIALRFEDAKQILVATT